ncbi:unnamed protein product [Clonostachys rhizophaga]|uniref:Major facilitator superfamily (MFS) profile domain-containing protein n=1 Tax=Clonostachys rhizophaga TaxID=160324 RepID=A0A9N9YR05_9HYPO|nr:unnamed protein product [Clonostachys rhizophaga]
MTSPAIPGTAQLVDVGHVLSAQHGKGDSDIVLIPQPSNKLNDPLNWSHRRKTTAIFWAMTWCVLAAAIISGLSPAYVMISEDTGISIADLSTANGVFYLFLGWGTLITQQLALSYGRRPVLVASSVLTTFVTLWSAYVRSQGEFYVNRIILGIVSSPMETLIEVIIGDIYFTHERGFFMGVYSWMLWCGAFICPVITGFIAESLGWRWIQYILTFVSAFMTITTFLFFEETMFYRGIIQTEIVGIQDRVQSVVVDGSTAEKGSSDPKAPTSSPPDSHSETAGPATYELDNERTYMQKLALWGYRNPKQPSQLKRFFMPFILLQFPGVVFAGLLVGSILAWYNVVGGSLALILSGPPYNFVSNVVGLFYLANAIGVTIGCIISSFASDRLALWMAKRNGGVMEPEHRLWLCLIGLLAHPAGCFLYGLGAFNQIHWAGIAAGLCLISITLPLGSVLAFTYILDTYPEVAGEGLVSSILIRNLLGFAFGYAVVPMIQNLNLKYAFVLISILGILLWSLCLLMIMVGKYFRRITAQRYWNLLAKHGGESH